MPLQGKEPTAKPVFWSLVPRGRSRESTPTSHSLSTCACGMRTLIDIYTYKYTKQIRCKTQSLFLIFPRNEVLSPTCSLMFKLFFNFTWTWQKVSKKLHFSQLITLWTFNGLLIWTIFSLIIDLQCHLYDIFHCCDAFLSQQFRYRFYAGTTNIITINTITIILLLLNKHIEINELLWIWVPEWKTLCFNTRYSIPFWNSVGMEVLYKT